MTDDLLSALLRALPTPDTATPRERAEAVWLVARLPKPESELVGQELDPYEDDEDPGPASSDKQERASFRAPSTPAPEAPPTFGAADAEGSTGWIPAEQEIPALPPLDDRRGHARGLSRLATRQPTRARRFIDLPESLRRSAIARESMLATSTGTRRSTHLVLLVDAAPSLAPWVTAMDQLRALARATPGLAATSLFTLDLSDPTTARIRDEHGTVELERVPRAGLDPLVVIWSDGLSVGFPALGPLLADLPPGARVAWMHPWPRHTWRRTPVGRLTPARLRPVAHGAANLPVVVVPFSRSGWDALGGWMHGRRPGRLPVVGLPRSLAKKWGRQRAEVEPGDWNDHVARLEGVLESDSVRLLALAAALPVTTFGLDLLRAIGAAAGLSGDPFLVAEALTAGLLVRAEPEGSDLCFRNESARAAARSALRDADFAALTAFAARAGLPDRLPKSAPVTVPVLVPGDHGSEGARAQAVGPAPAPTHAEPPAHEGPLAHALDVARAELAHFAADHRSATRFGVTYAHARQAWAEFFDYFERKLLVVLRPRADGAASWNPDAMDQKIRQMPKKFASYMKTYRVQSRTLGQMRRKAIMLEELCRVVNDAMRACTRAGPPPAESPSLAPPEVEPRSGRPVSPPPGVSPEPPAPPKGPTMTRLVHTTLQGALRALEQDLLGRSRAPAVETGLRSAWEAEQKAGQTGLGFDPWRRERITQIAVAWVLSTVFVRTLEDRGYIDPRIAGVDATALQAAEDRQTLFGQLAPFCGPREYLLTVFRELARLPGAKHVFDTRHNPVWVLAPSSDGASALLDFFRRTDDAGCPVLTFPGADTRFLGDLYQNLSEEVRKRYALLQTPEFIEEFILEQTLDPAIAEFGLEEVRLIDPTCGSGHFLLGAFARLLARWREARPMEPVEDLARRALGQVYGVDINPYAVAIARFRLVLALLDAVGIKRLERAPDLAPNLVVADSLLHRFSNEQTRLSSQVTLDEAAAWGDELFRLEDREAVERVLTKRFHAVVGNPPYITEKDPKKREKYREMYESAAGKYALAAPFTERFFGLGVEGGFVGMINSNAWTKREYGKTLIEQVLPRLDVQKIIDTSGCYIPGHGTPTLLLFGRNRMPATPELVAVLGKRGEQRVPPEAASAPVWTEIRAHHDDLGWDTPDSQISVETIFRQELANYPWVLTGGGARTLLRNVLAPVGATLGTLADSIGIVAVTGEDAVFPQSPRVFHRQRVEPTKMLVEGDELGDWDAQPGTVVPWMYNVDFVVRAELEVDSIVRYLWPHKAVISGRRRFGIPMVQRGYKWYELQELYASKLSTDLTIAFSLVSTHFRPVLFRARALFKNSAPVIKLSSGHTDTDHLALMGYLNSSTACCWCRLVMFPKGGDQVGDGARLSPTQWNRHLEFGGNLLQQLPVPELSRLKDTLLDLVVSAEGIVRQMGEASPENTLTAALVGAPSLGSLRSARDAMVAERVRLHGVLISLQEEMDWRVYGLFGLPTVTAPSVDAVTVPVAPEHRPFEVRLARDLTDISASEWFRVHHRTPPTDVAGPLADLYRQRLRLLDDDVRGKDLRLLETPETKRRWSPPDDAGAFRDAARFWLLDRAEDAFRSQSEPELRTAGQLALELRRDPRVQAVTELLTEESGHDLGRLLSELLDAEGVPFLAALRYTATGMEKRRGSDPDTLDGWELTWELQRAEDAGRLAEALAPKKLKSIPVPDKYAPVDFQRHYWGLRGALDVAKERFVSVHVGAADDDPTPAYGWAGWDHLQQAQALSGLYQRRKNDDGWPRERLAPLLAGLEERVPWLLQWHNAPSASFNGMKLGDFFRDFVHAQAHELALSVAELRAWRPAPPTRGRGRAPAVGEPDVLAALAAWDGEEDPRAEDLAERLGAPKATVSKLLKALVEAGKATLTSGRPARYRRAVPA